MNLTVMSCPLRSTAARGNRISSATWSSLLIVASPVSTAQATLGSRCRSYGSHANNHSHTRRVQVASTRQPLSNVRSIPLRTPTTPPSPILAQTTALRHASSSSTSTTAAAPDTSSSAAAASSTPVQLDWNSFFTLRASRRKYSLVSSILASLTTTATGAQFLASQNLESLGPQIMGFDPFIVLGLTTLACGAAGWLAGPVLGNAVWGMVYRKYKGAVSVKEKEFYDRIKRFRVDPSANSFANPVPDYYGEKIGSVQGYRQWLKDQRAYNRKKRNFV